MVKFNVKGDFSKTNKFLKNIQKKRYFNHLSEVAQMGVVALRDATPKDTGLTANSWSYKITVTNDSAKIVWTNSNLTTTGIPIAILIQYGHANQAGYYVEGIDYINPAMKPIFEEMAERAWKGVIL